MVNGLWTALGAASADAPNPLNGLPPLLPFRVVLTGTTDVMPGIGVGPNGWAYTWRPRSDFRHISTIQNLPAPVNVVFVDIRLEQWRGEPYQECHVRLLTGAPATRRSFTRASRTTRRTPATPWWSSAG